MAAEERATVEAAETSPATAVTMTMQRDIITFAFHLYQCYRKPQPFAD